MSRMPKPVERELGVGAASESPVFTDELPFDGKVRIETEKDFFGRVRAKLADVQAGKTVPRQATVSFESLEALAAVLTPKRLALLAAVKSQQQFDSIERLAEALDRDRSSVSKDLKILANAGLLLVAQKALRGHGLRTEIKRAADTLKLEMFI